jgi:hypothetical protein
VLADVWTPIGWILYFAWQVSPGILIWRLRVKHGLSLVGTVASAVIAVSGTAAAYYVGLTDSSSTAPLILIVAPIYLIGAVLVVFGVDFSVRALRGRAARFDKRDA